MGLYGPRHRRGRRVFGEPRLHKMIIMKGLENPSYKMKGLQGPLIEERSEEFFRAHS